mgnify:FL=1|tara:strand:+ start:1160 stop:1408 length:249 start_codon:yes stop_codon:yes gene_type:complete
MAYYVAENTGKGFITHPENELAHIAGYPANVWVTQNSSWASRVGATEKTREEAQSLVDISILGTVYPEGNENAGQQIVITLP